MDESVLAWHFVRDDHTLGYDLSGVKAYPGLVLSVPAAEVELCVRGLHASERPLDALHHAPGRVVCRVELSGRVLRGDDKCVASCREVLWVADASTALERFAGHCAGEATAATDRTTQRAAWRARASAANYIRTGYACHLLRAIGHTMRAVGGDLNAHLSTLLEGLKP